MGKKFALLLMYTETSCHRIFRAWCGHPDKFAHRGQTCYICIVTSLRKIWGGHCPTLSTPRRVTGSSTLTLPCKLHELGILCKLPKRINPMGSVVCKDTWSQVTMSGGGESPLLAPFFYHINLGVQFSFSQLLFLNQRFRRGL